ncbi:hypothetical protein V2J09_010257 [Rumex salicifolius]
MSDQEFVVTALQEENEEEEEEEDEAPSLSDLPLTGAIGEQIDQSRCSLSESAESFEFRTPNLNSSSYAFLWNDLDWSSFSSTADENHIIFTSSPPFSKSLSCSIKTLRSECSNESKIETRSSYNRSLGHRRIGRDIYANRSNRMDYDEFPPDRRNRNYSSSGAQRKSPPWYWLALGPSRYPPEVEIKLRSGVKSQQPRSPATLFPAGEKASCDRSTWRLINALSCKSRESVAATTPFHPYC